MSIPNTNRPRILFLYGDIPFPANTGARIRTYNLLINAAKDASITLLTMLDPTHETSDQPRIEHMRRFGIEVISVPRTPESKFAFVSVLLKSFFSPNPVIVDRYTYLPYVRKVREMIESNDFDLVHCDSISLAESVRFQDVTSVPWALTAHNVESIIWERWANEEPNIFKRTYVRFQYRKVMHYEKAISQKADLVCAVSEEDRSRLNSMFGAGNTAVVPNGVDTAYFAPQNIQEEADTLVFTGSMDWRPNQDGILWFVDEIWPRLVAQNPSLRFWIVGRRPPERLVQIGKSDPRLIVTGTVDDVRGFVARAAVYVVPLRIGGGSRLKILEAMSMRKGIVSTTVGAEGLQIEHDKQLILADSPESFCQRVIELLDNPARRHEFGKAGAKLVNEQYTWPEIARGQVRLWQETISSSRVRTQIRVKQ